MKDILMGLLQNEAVIGLVVVVVAAALRKRGLMNAASLLADYAPAIVSALSQENKSAGLAPAELKAEAVRRLTKMLPESDRLAAAGRVTDIANTTIESAVASAKERKAALGKLVASE